MYTTQIVARLRGIIRNGGDGHRPTERPDEEHTGTNTMSRTTDTDTGEKADSGTQNGETADKPVSTPSQGNTDQVVSGDGGTLPDDSALAGITAQENGHNTLDGAEIRDRVDELEHEIETLSSDLSAVEDKNKEIVESLDDIENNVHQLLQIYEQVTRGVNPFVDDTTGLSETGESTSNGNNCGSVVSQTASGHNTPEQKTADAKSTDSPSEQQTKTFEDLVGDGTAAGNPSRASETQEETVTGDTAASAGSSEAATGATPTSATGQRSDAERADASDNHPRTEAAGDALLTALPQTFQTEQVKLRWIEYLLGQGGPYAAGAALSYYVTVGWLSGPVANELIQYLAGVSQAEDVAETNEGHNRVDKLPADSSEWTTELFKPGQAALTRQQHVMSLRYIAMLVNPSQNQLFGPPEAPYPQHNGLHTPTEPEPEPN